MPGIDTPPKVFTPEEVLNLNEYQFSGAMHPFTCGGGHRTEHPDGEGILVATIHGWVCPFCDYTQNWAHEWMKNGDWRKTGTEQIEAALRALTLRQMEFYPDLVQALVAMVERYEHLESVVNRLVQRGAFAEIPLPRSRALARARDLMARMKEKGMLPEVQGDQENQSEPS